MRTLTQYQKDFLLNSFFQTEKYAKWEKVATKLLETGRCIVAGRDRIWIGGIGNFIGIVETEDAIDCLLYTFKLEEFLSSEWYKMIKTAYMKDLAEDIKKKKQEYDELFNLLISRHEQA